MRYFLIIVAMLMIWDDLSAEGRPLTQEVREKHFVFRVPETALSMDIEEDGSSFSFLSQGYIATLYAQRIRDLDRVFVLRENRSTVFLGLKVLPYRNHLRKNLTYEEFVNSENVESYEETLRDQLTSYGLSNVVIRDIVADQGEGHIRFVCQFETQEGFEAEEYYASILGSHEIVYLILFTDPPSKLQPSTTSLFRLVVDSFQFKQEYQYSPNSQTWWTRRTWGERAEVFVKLIFLFFFMRSALIQGFESMLETPLPQMPSFASHMVRAVSILLSLMVCWAFVKWVQS